MGLLQRQGRGLLATVSAPLPKPRQEGLGLVYVPNSLGRKQGSMGEGRYL